MEWRELEKLDQLGPEEFARWEREVPFYFMVDNDKRPGRYLKTDI